MRGKQGTQEPLEASVSTQTPLYCCASFPLSPLSPARELLAPALEAALVLGPRGLG